MPSIPNPPFDPEGDGYDYGTALRKGLGADVNGHGWSRDPETGMLLKGRKHESYQKGIEEDERMGLQEEKGEDGRYYTKPRFENGGPVEGVPHHHKGR